MTDADPPRRGFRWGFSQEGRETSPAARRHGGATPPLREPLLWRSSVSPSRPARLIPKPSRERHARPPASPLIFAAPRLPPRPPSRKRARGSSPPTPCPTSAQIVGNVFRAPRRHASAARKPRSGPQGAWRRPLFRTRERSSAPPSPGPFPPSARHPPKQRPRPRRAIDLPVVLHVPLRAPCARECVLRRPARRHPAHAPAPPFSHPPPLPSHPPPPHPSRSHSAQCCHPPRFRRFWRARAGWATASLAWSAQAPVAAR